MRIRGGVGPAIARTSAGRVGIDIPDAVAPHQSRGGLAATGSVEQARLLVRIREVGRGHHGRNLGVAVDGEAWADHARSSISIVVEACLCDPREAAALKHDRFTGRGAGWHEAGDDRRANHTEVLRRSQKAVGRDDTNRARARAGGDGDRDRRIVDDREARCVGAVEGDLCGSGEMPAGQRHQGAHGALGGRKAREGRHAGDAAHAVAAQTVGFDAQIDRRAFAEQAAGNNDRQLGGARRYRCHGQIGEKEFVVGRCRIEIGTREDQRLARHEDGRASFAEAGGDGTQARPNREAAGTETASSGLQAEIENAGGSFGDLNGQLAGARRRDHARGRAEANLVVAGLRCKRKPAAGERDSVAGRARVWRGLDAELARPVAAGAGRARNAQQQGRAGGAADARLNFAIAVVDQGGHQPTGCDGEVLRPAAGPFDRRPIEQIPCRVPGFEGQLQGLSPTAEKAIEGSADFQAGDRRRLAGGGCAGLAARLRARLG